jgi:hypothetical protein
LSFVPVPIERVKKVQSLNSNGEFPEELLDLIERADHEKKIDYLNVVGQDDLTRFDKASKKKKRFKKKNNNHRSRAEKKNYRRE